MLVDTHVHINAAPLYRRWQEVVAEAKLAGLDRLVVPGVDLSSSQRSVNIAQIEPRIFSAVGIHPETLLESDGYDLAQIERLSHEPKVIGIGEIGLDYYQHTAPAESQRLLFREQLAIAKERQLPVIIHSRTEAAMIDVVAEIRLVYGSHLFQGVFHCFSGSKGFYETVAALGGMIGVGGMITYTHQTALQQLVSTIPLTSIILETDAPWLTPQPRPRGVNSPANVTIVAAKLAALQAIQLTTVLETTGENACRLFPSLGQPL